MMIRSSLLILSLFFFLSGSTSQTRYSVTELSSTGHIFYLARSINDSGQIIGLYSANKGVAPNGFGGSAGLYDHGVVTELGTLGGSASDCGAINNAGQIVGTSQLPDNIRNAFLFELGSMHGIGTLGGNYSAATDINDSGLIVGYSDIGGDNDSSHAFLYRNGNWTDLKTLGGGYSAAAGINEAGAIVGYTQMADFFDHAFIYDNGVMTDLGTLGGLQSFAAGINESGHIAGYSTIPGNVYTHAFLDTNGTMFDIGHLGGGHSRAYGINNADQVVGTSLPSPPGYWRAFLWQNGSMKDLNSLIDSSSGWVLESATAINNRGQIVGSGKHNGQSRAFLLTPSPRWPVFIVPGIGATYPVDVNNVAPWMFTRGIHPTGLQIDPLAHAYDDLIQTLKNVGYVEGKDLFVVNYDWRVVPGPSDSTFDGVVNGLSAASITDASFEYAVDYLGYYLMKAMDAWEADHPGTTLDSVNIIAHSTGGLVARTYIQSAAHGGTFGGSRKLPRVENLIMVGVPNRGASKAWNPLHDNWGVDITFQLVLSKIINLGYQKVQAGAIITGPDIDISLNSLTSPICLETPELCFVHQFNPTARALLATYDFIDFGNGFTNVNSNPNDRNALLLDLNAGLDLALQGDPNSFADSARVTVIYATNLSTPTAVVEKVGPSGHEDAVVRFTDFATRDALPGEIWYDDIVAPSSGDGTVPLESASGQFIGDARVNLQPFAIGSNTAEDVSHLGLMYNTDVQKEILSVLRVEYHPNDISNSLHAAFASLMSTAGNVAANIIGGNILGAILDPVDGYIVDGNGKRLGFSTVTGPKNEIPGSIWFGDTNGIGWVMQPLVSPASLHLSGLGGNYYTMVSVLGDPGESGLIDQGFLASGETRDLGITGTPTGIGDAGLSPVPQAYSLAQNFPNPFNPTTEFRYTIPAAGHVSLIVSDVLGRTVATLVDEFKAPGEYTITWNAGNLSSGIYFYRLTAGSFDAMKKLILLK